MKQQKFPENPFTVTYAKIFMIDAVVMVVAVILAIWQSAWMWYALGGGLLISIAVFVLLGKQCLKQLSCPKCAGQVVFEANRGFVCGKCKIGWEMG